MGKILIIGASGLLGSRMTEVYQSNYEVYGTYKEHGSLSKNHYKLDAIQRNEVSNLIGKLKPDLIIDTHGLTSLDYCEANKEEAWKINVEGTRNIAESAKSTGSKYIFISTDAVFNGEKTSLYTENDVPDPINYYGITKASAEKVVISLDDDFIIARTSTLFGKGGHRQLKSFTNWVIEQLRNKQKISVATDQYNNPTYTDNLCQFVQKLYEKDARGIFHTAGKDTISRFEFANKIADTFDLDKNLILSTTTAELKLKARRALQLGLDISKAEKETAIRGMGIREALDAFSKII